MLAFLRQIASEEPVEATAVRHIGPESEVDEWAAGSLKFANGGVASFHCATRAAQPPVAIVYGDKGFIEVAAPWHLDPSAAKIRVVYGEEEETLTAGDGLAALAREALEVELHLQAREVPKMTWGNSLGQATFLARLRRSMGLRF